MRLVLILRRSLCSGVGVSPGVNSYTLRTHTCGELRSRHVGQKVTVFGWMLYRRLPRFLVLRDAYGLIQAIFQGTKGPAKNLPLESTLRLTGVVVERPPKDRNPNMGTGDVELSVSQWEVLNQAHPEQMPFDGREFYDVMETWRTKYRYIDLRKSTLQHNLRLRSQVVQQMREYMLNNSGFIEVETPTLFRQTPGGAREFPVPSSTLPGKFYSLVQSPQQFKQLLMVGGIDRYFQVARCYRDELTTKERQPEFTQIDIELSFTTSEQIMNLIEDMIRHSWPSELPPILGEKFPRISYAEAMQNYGTDKPDIRFDAKIQDISPSDSNINIQAFVLPAIGAYFTSEMLDSIRPYYDQLAEKCEFSVKSQFLPEISNSLKNSLAKLNAKSNDLVVIAWGENLVKVRATLGFFRAKIADVIEIQYPGAVRDPANFSFLWVTDFPLFTASEKTGLLEPTHHPFTAPISEHEPLIFTAPESAIGQHYDLVLNGVEIGGGSIRIHEAAMQKYVLENILREPPGQLNHLQAALDSGAPPHGGIALGLDRYIALLCGAKSIRDVMAFPKSASGRDRMGGAPAELSKEFLAQYHIATVASEAPKKNDNSDDEK